MKTLPYLVCSLLVVWSSVTHAKRELVDRIVARVNGHNILHSELALSRINHQGPFTLKEAVEQQLYLQEALRRKIVPSQMEVEKYLASYKVNNGFAHMSDKEFEKEVTRFGFTIDLLRREFARVHTVETLLHQEIKSRVFVSRQEVEAYHAENPEYVDAVYTLQTVLVPFRDAATIEEAQRGLAKRSWVQDAIKESDLSESMKIVTSLDVGHTSQVIKTAHGYQFVKLLKKEERKASKLKARYGAIEHFLREQKMSLFEKRFLKELEARATIVYL